ncbi:TIGR01777 family oxidoreductase [Altericista sp. CCNU0014]|uniref:thylakoid membrane protein ThyD n=1 Tax=Altericista sp. CCNU0014 TaxID=3082949 RepID=UPI00384B1C7D
MKVAVTGGTGFIGSRLVDRLQAEGHQVLLLVRNVQKAQQRFPQAEVVSYTPKTSGPWQQAIAGCDGIVNLAGEPIANRWTENSKKEILESRQLGTQKIVEAIAQADPKPSVLVNASAIGYYGTSETAVFDENSNPGSDFLAAVCQAWEAEAEKVKASGTRLVILRTGIVLGPGGGVLARMTFPFQLFAGGPLGNGKQWVSWIHRDDLVSLIIKALTDPAMEGTFNATAPNAVSMDKLCQALGDILQRPSWLPVPDFALELLLGEAAKLVLEGQNVKPQKTEASGFQFQYPTLKAALSQILK